MRWAVGCGLLLLGLLVVDAPGSVAQVPPGTPTTRVTPTPAPVTPAPVTPTSTFTSPSTSSTSTLPKTGRAGGSGTGRLPTLGEGFPWITVGAVILIAGLVGARLRRASRR